MIDNVAVNWDRRYFRPYRLKRQLTPTGRIMISRPSRSITNRVNRTGICYHSDFSDRANTFCIYEKGEGAVIARLRDNGEFSGLWFGLTNRIQRANHCPTVSRFRKPSWTSLQQRGHINAMTDFMDLKKYQ